MQITATNDGEGNAAACLAASSNEDTGSSGDGLVTSIVLVRQNARHLFEPRTPETEVTSSSEPAVVGSSLSELIVVQDECAGCLPLAAMLRPQRHDNHLSTAKVAPLPETGACSTQHYGYLSCRRGSFVGLTQQLFFFSISDVDTTTII